MSITSVVHTIGTKLVSNLCIKRISMLTGLKVSSLTCKCVFYRTKQNAKGVLNRVFLIPVTKSQFPLLINNFQVITQ